MINPAIKRKVKDQKEKIEALAEIKKWFQKAVEMYGFENARWAFRKVIELNSEKVRLLKRKSDLLKELKDIEKQI